MVDAKAVAVGPLNPTLHTCLCLSVNSIELQRDGFLEMRVEHVIMIEYALFDVRLNICCGLCLVCELCFTMIIEFATYDD